MVFRKWNISEEIRFFIAKTIVKNDKKKYLFLLLLKQIYKFILLIRGLWSVDTNVSQTLYPVCRSPFFLKSNLSRKWTDSARPPDSYTKTISRLHNKNQFKTFLFRLKLLNHSKTIFVAQTALVRIVLVLKEAGLVNTKLILTKVKA